MKRLSSPVLAAKLLEFNHRTAQCSNATILPSTALMLQRYFQIEEHLCNIKIEYMMPGARATRNLIGLCELLSQLEYVAKELQKSSATLADVRALFDAVIEDYSESDHYLSMNANVVHKQEFKSGLLKF